MTGGHPLQYPSPPSSDPKSPRTLQQLRPHQVPPAYNTHTLISPHPSAKNKVQKKKTTAPQPQTASLPPTPHTSPHTHNRLPRPRFQRPNIQPLRRRIRNHNPTCPRIQKRLNRPTLLLIHPSHQRPRRSRPPHLHKNPRLIQRAPAEPHHNPGSPRTPPTPTNFLRKQQPHRYFATDFIACDYINYLPTLAPESLGF